jgi:hypothetical protein
MALCNIHRHRTEPFFSLLVATGLCLLFLMLFSRNGNCLLFLSVGAAVPGFKMGGYGVLVDE